MKKDENRQLEVKFYRSPGGKEPLREMIKEFSREIQKIIGEDIRAVQKTWPLVGLPLVKKIEKNMWEIRTHIPNGIVRVFFTIKYEHIVLLHGFIKKTQKTPMQELKIAQNRLKELQE